MSGRNSIRRARGSSPDMPDMQSVYKHKKQGDAPRVKSWERRAAIVPHINRSSIARRVPCFGLRRILIVRASTESSRNVVLPASRLAPPRLATRRPALPRPAPRARGECMRKPCVSGPSIAETTCVRTQMDHVEPCNAPPVGYPGLGFDRFGPGTNKF